MAFWSKKKTDTKLISYFIDKKIPYEIDNSDRIRIKFELCLTEKKIMIYPYLTIDEDVISFNVNLVEHTLKSFNYERLNQFNLKSRYFKAYVTDAGIIVLEYRFILCDDLKIMDELIQSLVDMQEEIDLL